MKQLILILSLTLMAGVANAGGSNMTTNCPHAKGDRFDTTAVKADKKVVNANGSTAAPASKPGDNTGAQ